MLRFCFTFFAIHERTKVVQTDPLATIPFIPLFNILYIDSTYIYIYLYIIYIDSTYNDIFWNLMIIVRVVSKSFAIPIELIIKNLILQSAYFNSHCKQMTNYNKLIDVIQSHFYLFIPIKPFTGSEL